MESDLAAAALAGLAERRVLAVAVVRQGQLAWASPALRAMFGLETAAEPQSFLDLVAPEDRDTVSEVLAEGAEAELTPSAFTGLRADGSHFDAIVIGEVFAGQSLVKQQQLVYATVVDRITNGQLHALSIKTYTPQDWERAKKLQVSP